jgi:L-seryl-tRNA(Ser) seleniumtransferase
MRPDTPTLAAVAATLGISRAGAATREIPVWRAIAARVDEIRARAAAVAEAVAAGGDVEIVWLEATVGGGSLPGEVLASAGLALAGPAEPLLARLRRGSPAVVGRIERGRVVLDLRTVEPARDDDLAAAIRGALRR